MKTFFYFLLPGRSAEFIDYLIHPDWRCIASAWGSEEGSRRVWVLGAVPQPALWPIRGQGRGSSAALSCPGEVGRGWGWAPGSNPVESPWRSAPLSQVHGFPATRLGTLYGFTWINPSSLSWGRKCHHPHLAKKEIGSRGPWLTEG